jgi:hypothetical protein
LLTDIPLTVFRRQFCGLVKPKKSEDSSLYLWLGRNRICKD